MGIGRKFVIEAPERHTTWSFSPTGEVASKIPDSDWSNSAKSYPLAVSLIFNIYHSPPFHFKFFACFRHPTPVLDGIIIILHAPQSTAKVSACASAQDGFEEARIAASGARNLYLFTVAQIFNLPYRRFVIGRTLFAGGRWQVKNLRYSRLQVCATGAASTLTRNRVRPSGRLSIGPLWTLMKLALFFAAGPLALAE